MVIKNWIEVKPDWGNWWKIIFPNNREIKWYKTKDDAMNVAKKFVKDYWTKIIENWKNWKYRNRIKPQTDKKL